MFLKKFVSKFIEIIDSFLTLVEISMLKLNDRVL